MTTATAKEQLAAVVAELQKRVPREQVTGENAAAVLAATLDHAGQQIADLRAAHRFYVRGTS